MKSFGKNFSIGALILLALYAIITFIICEFKGSVGFWISFVFMCFSLLLISAISFITSSKFKSLRDWIFNLPIMKWSIIYAAVEFAVSLLFMLIPMGWKVPFIIQLLLMVLFVALICPSIGQRKYVEQTYETTTKKVVFARLLHAQLSSLLPRVADYELKSVLSEVVEQVRHCDPMSHESLADLEKEIKDLSDTLEEQIKSEKTENAKITCKELSYKINERTQTARALKLSQY